MEVLRQSYDVNNPVIAEIIKAKEHRLKILQELKKEQEEKLDINELELTDTITKKSKNIVKKERKSESHFPRISLRRSLRLQSSSNVFFSKEENDKPETVKNQIVRPPNDYGPMPGVDVGFQWETRMECSLYGVHRPTVAGIHGGPNGAYSIALSGGYPEDVDEGNSFIYTGAGGRDLKGTSSHPKNLRVALQTKDQQLEGTNLSLVKSIKSKLPVRVIRGYKSPSIFAPEIGYRYDGLYQVIDYWEAVGKSGHRIYQFKLERMKNQAPPPWEENNKNRIGEKKDILKNAKFKDKLLGLEENDNEHKENIRPSEMNENKEFYKNLNDAEVKDIDNEIQMCLNLFFKLDQVRNDSYLKNNFESFLTNEDFLGWDIV